jgi:hypothetical protein
VGARQWPERTWAIEGAGGLGHLLAQQLIGVGEKGFDVQPKLAARMRLLNTGLVNKKVVNALGGGPLASSWQAAKLHRVADGDYSAQFPFVARAQGRSSGSGGCRRGAVAALAGLADEWMQAVDQGLGQQDLTVVTRALEQQDATP